MVLLTGDGEERVLGTAFEFDEVNTSLEYQLVCKAYNRQSLYKSGNKKNERKVRFYGAGDQT